MKITRICVSYEIEIESRDELELEAELDAIPTPDGYRIDSYELTVLSEKGEW